MTTHEAFTLELVASGFLRVDETGEVWRCQARTRTGRLKPVTPRRADRERPDGYRRVLTQVAGVAHSIAAHRLVWLVHVGSIPAGYEINHRNGDRGDNALANLELATKSENLQHSYDQLARVRMHGERNGRSKLTVDQVQEIRRRRAAGEAGRALAREFDVTPTLIRKIVSGRAWSESSR